MAVVAEHMLAEHHARGPCLAAAAGAQVLAQTQRPRELAVKGNVCVAGRLQLGQGCEVLANVDGAEGWRVRRRGGKVAHGWLAVGSLVTGKDGIRLIDNEAGCERNPVDEGLRVVA